MGLIGCSHSTNCFLRKVPRPPALALAPQLQYLTEVYRSILFLFLLFLLFLGFCPSRTLCCQHHVTLHPGHLHCIVGLWANRSRPVSRAAFPAGIRAVDGSLLAVVQGGVHRPDEEGQLCHVLCVICVMSYDRAVRYSNVVQEGASW